jgi:putative membrane protein
MMLFRIAGAATAFAACVLLSTSSCFAMPNGTDRTFVMKAAQGGLGEVAEGRLALSKSAGPAVARIAARMVHDHGAANQQLAAIASRKGLSVPVAPGPPDRAMLMQLRPLNGRTFAMAYLRGQRTAHIQTIALFRQEIANGHDRDLVAFARTTLPTIEAHLAMIREAMM